MKGEAKKGTTTRTTFDRMMEKPGFKKKFDEEYDRLVLSELIVELMESEGLSVRELAKKTGVSKTVIQELRSGEKENPTLSVFAKLIHSMGGDIVIKKGKKTLATV